MTAVFRMRMPQLRTNVMALKTVSKVPDEYSVTRSQYKTMDFDQIHLFLYPDSGIFGSHFINTCITLTNTLHLDESLHIRAYAVTPRSVAHSHSQKTASTSLLNNTPPPKDRIPHVPE
jgi:hypothetical protein